MTLCFFESCRRVPSSCLATIKGESRKSHLPTKWFRSHPDTVLFVIKKLENHLKWNCLFTQFSLRLQNTVSSRFAKNTAFFPLQLSLLLNLVCSLKCVCAYLWKSEVLLLPWYQWVSSTEELRTIAWTLHCLSYYFQY